MGPNVVRAALAGFLVLSLGLAVTLLNGESLLPPQISAARIIPSGQPPGRPDLKTPLVSADPAAPERSLIRPTDASGDLVRLIARELSQRGYAAGPDDGIVRLVLRAAIFAFEIDHGLPPSAEPSDRLLKSILFAVEPVPPVPLAASVKPLAPRAEEVVRSVEETLAVLHIYRSRVEGRISAELIRSIRAFEVQHGMVSSGRISGPLIEALAIAVRQARSTPARPGG